MTQDNPSASHGQTEELHSIVKLNEAKAALAEAKDLRDVMQVKNVAEAIKAYHKAAGHSLDIQNQAAEVKLRAERKAGQLINEMREAGQLAAHGGVRHGAFKRSAEALEAGAIEKAVFGDAITHLNAPDEKQITANNPALTEAIRLRAVMDEKNANLEAERALRNDLAHLGISTTTAHVYRKLAELSEESLDEHIEEVRAAGKELTNASAMRVAKAGEPIEPDQPEASKGLEGVFGLSEQFPSLMNAVHALQREVKELAASPVGRCLNEAAGSDIDVKLHAVWHWLKGAQPWAECPLCRGRRDNCDACWDSRLKKTTGWVSRYQYQERIKDGLKSADDITYDKWKRK